MGLRPCRECGERKYHAARGLCKACYQSELKKERREKKFSEEKIFPLRVGIKKEYID